MRCSILIAFFFLIFFAFPRVRAHAEVPLFDLEYSDTAPTF